MNFKFFINEESDDYKKARSTPITNEEVIELLKTDYSEAWENHKKGITIFRGTQSDHNALITDPSIGTRVSANTRNYYTAVIDNSPRWKKFPKRSKSVICTTDKNYAGNYGEQYVVFPINGSKIGVCSKEDFWESFPIIRRRFTELPIGTNLNSLNRVIASLMNLADPHGTTDVKTIATLKKKFVLIDEYLNNKKYLENEDINQEFIDLTLDALSYKGKIEDSIEGLLDPDLNNMQLVSVKDFNFKGKHEVWTDGKCLLIERDILRHLAV